MSSYFQNFFEGQRGSYRRQSVVVERSWVESFKGFQRQLVQIYLCDDRSRLIVDSAFVTPLSRED